MISSYSKFLCCLNNWSRITKVNLFSETVFVGESKFDTFRDTLYAIPSYIDDNTPTVKSNAVNLIEGPNTKITQGGTFDSRKRSSKRNYIIFGHYDKPSMESMFNSIGSKDSDKQLTVQSDKNLWYIKDDGEDSTEGDKIIIPSESNETSKKGNVTVIEDEELVQSKKKFGLLKTLLIKFKTWFDNEDNKILKLLMVILIGIVITMFWYFHITVRELRQQTSQNGSNTKIPRSTDSNGSYGVEPLDGGELIVLIVIVDVSVVVNFVHRVINDLRLIDYFQMFLKRSNNCHEIYFQTCNE